MVKFWRNSLEDEEFLAAIHDELQEAIGESATLDGHDTTAREINLFVVTPDPRRSFRRLKAVLDSRGIVHGVSAAYRLVGGVQFTSIWPLRTTRKFKLPSNRLT